MYVVVWCCTSVDICDTEGQPMSAVVIEYMLLSGVVQVLIDVTREDIL